MRGEDSRWTCSWDVQKAYQVSAELRGAGVLRGFRSSFNVSARRLPTRAAPIGGQAKACPTCAIPKLNGPYRTVQDRTGVGTRGHGWGLPRHRPEYRAARSEEHTSELQSP